MFETGERLRYLHANGDIEQVEVLGEATPTRTGMPRWYVRRLRDGRPIVVGQASLVREGEPPLRRGGQEGAQ